MIDGPEVTDEELEALDKLAPSPGMELIVEGFRRYARRIRRLEGCTSPDGLRARLVAKIAEWREWVVKEKAADRGGYGPDLTTDFADELEALLEGLPEGDRVG